MSDALVTAPHVTPGSALCSRARRMPSQDSNRTSNYALGRPATFTLAQLAVLDLVRQSQVVQLFEARTGAFYAHFAACAAAVRESLALEDDSDFRMDLYSITRLGDDEPSFEMWVCPLEHGMVFPTRSDEPTGVHCVLGHFRSADPDDADASELARALNVVPF